MHVQKRKSYKSNKHIAKEKKKKKVAGYCNLPISNKN